MAQNDRTTPDQTKVITDGKTVASAGGKCWVACKLPAGLVLYHEQKVTRSEATPRGPQSFDIYQRVGKPIVLNGSAQPVGVQQHLMPKHTIVGGYGITMIERDDWDKWMSVHKNSDLVANLQVHALDSEADAIAWCREHSQVRSGLEAMLQDKDPRNRSLLANASGIAQVGRDGDRMAPGSGGFAS